MATGTAMAAGTATAGATGTGTAMAAETATGTGTAMGNGGNGNGGGQWRQWRGQRQRNGNGGGNGDGGGNGNGKGAGGGQGGGAASGGLQAGAGSASGATSPAGGAPAKAANADHEGQHGFEPGEVVVLGDRPETLARLQRLGFRLIEARPFAALGLSVLKLSTPTGLDPRQGVALLHARYPELTADVNSLYGTYETEATQVVSLPAPDYARRMIRWSGGEGCGAGLRIGMIDSALAAGLPTFAGRKLHQRSFVKPGHTAADPAHGTAIAALLVGAPDPAHLTAGGLLPDADLYAAAVFERQGGQSQASAFAIAAALNWMVQQSRGGGEHQPRGRQQRADGAGRAPRERARHSAGGRGGERRPRCPTRLSGRVAGGHRRHRRRSGRRRFPRGQSRRLHRLRSTRS